MHAPACFQDVLGRYEENACLTKPMEIAGHQETALDETQSYGHGMVSPAVPLLLNTVKEVIVRTGEKR